MMSELEQALEMLRTTTPTIQHIHYADEVKRVSAWALDAIRAGNEMADEYYRKLVGEQHGH